MMDSDKYCSSQNGFGQRCPSSACRLSSFEKPSNWFFVRYADHSSTPRIETGRRTSDYRVKLCALPASTLMMLPVDLADMSEAKK